jgi:hypothetical protein
MPYIARVLPGKTGQQTGNSGQLSQLSNLLPHGLTGQLVQFLPIGFISTQSKRFILFQELNLSDFYNDRDQREKTGYTFILVH